MQNVNGECTACKKPLCKYFMESTLKQSAWIYCIVELFDLEMCRGSVQLLLLAHFPVEITWRIGSVKYSSLLCLILIRTYKKFTLIWPWCINSMQENFVLFLECLVALPHKKSNALKLGIYSTRYNPFVSNAPLLYPPEIFMG